MTVRGMWDVYTNYFNTFYAKEEMKTHIYYLSSLKKCFSLIEDLKAN